MTMIKISITLLILTMINSILIKIIPIIGINMILIMAVVATNIRPIMDIIIMKKVKTKYCCLYLSMLIYFLQNIMANIWQIYIVIVLILNYYYLQQNKVYETQVIVMFISIYCCF